MLLLSLLAAAAVFPETKAQAEQIATQIHIRFDLNHDGYTTYEEVRQATYAAIAAKTPTVELKNIPDVPLVRAEFAMADADHDGRLSLAEDLAALDRAFDEQDADHDGTVTSSERAAFIQHYVERLKAERAALR
jgi:Ca2+-binding EF-hand superfamily protein